MKTSETLLCGMLMLIGASHHFADGSFNATGGANHTGDASEVGGSTSPHPGGPGPVTVGTPAEDLGPSVTHVPETTEHLPSIAPATLLPNDNQSDPGTSSTPKSPTPASVEASSMADTTLEPTQNTSSSTTSAQPLIPFELSTKTLVSTSHATPPSQARPPTGTATKAKEESVLPTEAKNCSKYKMVKYCLIAIACLAGLATGFIVSTIALCLKLSRHKYKLQRCSDDTEMMCISSILPEVNSRGKHQRNHVSNGVLVIHAAGDSDDDDMDDNLTLRSFLPDNDKAFHTPAL